MNKLTLVSLAALLLTPLAALRAAEPFPGAKGDHYGAAIYSMHVGERTVQILCPENPLPGKPWVLALQLYGTTNSGPTANMARTELELVKRGFHVVAGARDLAGVGGGPTRDGQSLAAQAHERGALGQTVFAGHLLIHRIPRCDDVWRAEPRPCLYMDKGVCDFKSWPGGKLGIGKGSPKDWASLIQLYHFKSEAEALAYDRNPVDLAPKLAAAKVAVIYVMGSKDDVVPYAENGARIEEQYNKLGGTFKLIRHEGEGHWPHGLQDPTPVVDFIQAHAR